MSLVFKAFYLPYPAVDFLTCSAMSNTPNLPLNLQRSKNDIDMTDSATQATTDNKLLKLPPEIRNQIYELVLVPTSAKICFSDSIKQPDVIDINIALLQTCQQVHREALAVVKDKASLSRTILSHTVMRYCSAELDPPSVRNASLSKIWKATAEMTSTTRDRNSTLAFLATIESMLEFRNVGFKLCLSPYFWRKNEYQSVLKLVRSSVERHQQIYPHSCSRLEVTFGWRILFPANNINPLEAKERKRCVRQWQEASAALDALIWTLEADGRCTLSLKKDVRFLVQNLNKAPNIKCMYPEQDDNGMVLFKKHRPGTTPKLTPYTLRFTEQGNCVVVT